MIKWLLAWRYFFKRPISILAVTAVALCVFIVLVVMTVMNGLVRDFKQKNHDYAGDCIIASDSLVGFGYYEELMEFLQKQPTIEAVSPVVRGVGLLSQPGRDWNMGVEVHGVDPMLHSQATNFAETLYYRRENPALAFSPMYAPQADGCILGIDLSPSYRQPDGSYAHAPQPGQYNLMLSVFPLNIKGGLQRSIDMVSTKTFSYSDDSHSGLVKVDGMVVYVPLEQAQTLCGMDIPIKRISSLHIKFQKGVSQRASVEEVRQRWNEFAAQNASRPGGDLFANVRVQSWQENRRSTIAPMEKEQTMMTMLFLMLGVITVFIVFVVLYMIISHKSKDIGILKSIGISLSDIVCMFLLFSVYIALIGVLIGSAAGWAFLYKVNDIEGWLYEHYHWQLWDRSVYAIGKIPNKVEMDVLASIVGSAMLACMIGAVVPSLQAARKRPVQSLQVNQL
ncbi:MAG: FtsX-like permease family protein [Phycisphaerae bacterium]|nr:FtsX-like permease family protein [Phycisphaerae bacterium]